AQRNEIDSLHAAAGGDVEAGDDAFGETHGEGARARAAKRLARGLRVLFGERERLLEVERALVDGAPGDDPADALGLDLAQRLDVAEVGEAAARDDRRADLARELEGRVDVHPREH